MSRRHGSPLIKGALVFAAALTLGLAFSPGSLLSHERVTTTVTYDREIVRIVNNKCIACHSERNLGTPLTTYEETRPWARAIQEEILSRHMPPWRGRSFHWYDFQSVSKRAVSRN